MNDQELAAEARRVGYLLRRCSGDVDRLAGTLLAELADRLTAAQNTDEALAGVERALELGETAWALEHVRLTRGHLALDEGGHHAAGLEVVLAFHEEHGGHCGNCRDAYGEPVEWPCDEFRAITAALTPAAQPAEGSDG